MNKNERQKKVCDLINKLRQERKELFFAANDDDKHLFRIYSHSGFALAVTKSWNFSRAFFKDYMDYIPDDQSGSDLKAAIEKLKPNCSLQNWIDFYDNKALLDTWIETHRRWACGMHGSSDRSKKRWIEKHNQHIIAVNNSSQIADFEFTSKGAGKNARADLVLFDEQETLLTYVEYKCTYGALTSESNGLLNHIIDMSKSANCGEINQEAVKRYYRRRMQNEDSVESPKSRVVTLITFDKNFNGENMGDQRLTPQALYNHLYKEDHPKAYGVFVKDFIKKHYEDVRFLVYDRCEDVDFSDYEKDLLTIDELIHKLTTTARYGVKVRK